MRCQQSEQQEPVEGRKHALSQQLAQSGMLVLDVAFVALSAGAPDPASPITAGTAVLPWPAYAPSLTRKAKASGSFSVPSLSAGEGAGSDGMINAFQCL
jgi:hypothetical protein